MQLKAKIQSKVLEVFWYVLVLAELKCFEPQKVFPITVASHWDLSIQFRMKRMTKHKKYQKQLKTNLELFSSQKYDEDLQRSLNKSHKDIHLVWTWQLWPLDSWDEKAERQTSKINLNEATSVHQWQQCSKLQRYDAAVQRLRCKQGDFSPHFSRMRVISCI